MSSKIKSCYIFTKNELSLERKQFKDTPKLFLETNKLQVRFELCLEKKWVPRLLQAFSQNK